MKCEWLNDEQIKDIAERSIPGNDTPVKVSEILSLCEQSYERNRLREGLAELKELLECGAFVRQFLSDDKKTEGMRLVEQRTAGKIRDLLDGAA